MGAKKNEMERLVKIFTECIEQHENFELMYSKKLDCYLLLELNSYRKDVEAVDCCYEPKEFCQKMFEIIAQDAFALSEAGTGGNEAVAGCLYGAASGI